MDFETERMIGTAFDLAEEALDELEKLAGPQIGSLARKLPEPHRRELLGIQRKHVAYATGLIRSASARLFGIIPPHCIAAQGRRLRYKPLIETPKALPAKISKGVYSYEEHLSTVGSPKTRRRYGGVL